MCLPGLARRMPATRFCRCCKMKESTAHHQMMLRSSDLFKSAPALSTMLLSYCRERAIDAECAPRPFHSSLRPWDCEGQDPLQQTPKGNHDLFTVYDLTQC